MLNTRTINSGSDKQLVKFSKGTAFLEINGKSSISSDPFLMVKKDTGTGYFVNGVVGFGGLGFKVYISTQKLVSGLRTLGFDIDAKTLRKWISSN